MRIRLRTSKRWRVALSPIAACRGINAVSTSTALSELSAHRARRRFAGRSTPARSAGGTLTDHCWSRCSRSCRRQRPIQRIASIATGTDEVLLIFIFSPETNGWRQNSMHSLEVASLHAPLPVASSQLAGNHGDGVVNLVRAAVAVILREAFHRV